MRSLAAAALAGGAVGGATSAVADEHDEADDETSDDDVRVEHPNARPILVDTSDPRGFDAEMHLDGDPDPLTDEDARGWIVHATSQSAETNDYAASLVSFRRRLGRFVTLGDLADGSMTYDYFRGHEHTGSAPDEVMLVLQTPDQFDTDGGIALFKHVDDDQEPPADADDGEWRTVDVVEEMTTGTWRAAEIDGDPWRLRLEEEGVEGELGRMAENASEDVRSLENVFGEYGADARVVAVGWGVGTVQEPVAVDAYFDDLVVDIPVGGESADEDAADASVEDEDPEDENAEEEGDPEDAGNEEDDDEGDAADEGDEAGDEEDDEGAGDEEDAGDDDGDGETDRGLEEFVFGWPAAIPMELSFSADAVGTEGDTVTANLELTQEEMGLELDRLFPETVKLHPYSEIAPPIGGGARADQVSLIDDGYEMTFRGEDIAALDGIGDGEQPVLVVAELNHWQVVWVYGHATLTVQQ